MDAGTLHDAIAVSCPVSSTRVIDENDRATWSFQPAPEATPTQIAAGNNVIATIDVTVKSILQSDDFISRWTNAEYRLLLQNRAAVANNGIAGMHKDWDTLISRGQFNLTNQKATKLKADLVTNGILTQIRADEIFK